MALPKAQYEDLELIRNEWGKIVRTLGGVIRSSFRDTVVEPSGEGCLCVVFASVDNFEIGRRPTIMGELEQYVKNTYGKDIYFKARLMGTGERMDTVYVSDEELRNGSIWILQSKKSNFRRRKGMAKRGGFPRRNAWQYEQSDEAGTAHAETDGGDNQRTEAKEYTAAAGGGAVSVTVSGKKRRDCSEDFPEAVDPDDVEMLEDLIMAATNEAFPPAGGSKQQCHVKTHWRHGRLRRRIPF